MKLRHIAMALACILLLTACGKKEETFIPSAEISLKNDALSVPGDTVSEKFVTATIERQDKVDQETTFTIKFLNKEAVYAVDQAGIKIDSLSTKPLRGKNAMDVLQFKVFGKKGEAETATYRIGIDLMWGNQTLQQEQVKVSVE
ncbi:MAG: hypothetical protein QME12_05085 [Nanoarchaeota archaeon]|nr:hypothetical protein [Nanoarchaeota archaeon]